MITLLGGLCALFGIWMAYNGTKVIIKWYGYGEKGTIKIGKESVEVTGTGGIILTVVGAILVIYSISAMLTLKNLQKTKAELGTLQREYATLTQSHQNLLAERDVLLRGIDQGVVSSLQQTKTLPQKIDETRKAVHAELGKVPGKDEFESLAKQVSELQANQRKLALEQTELLNTAKNVEGVLNAQARDFESVRAKLRTLEIQTDVAEVIADASPTEFSPTFGWEFVEKTPAKKGEQRRFVLEKTSPAALVQSKTVSLTWQIKDPDKKVVQFEGTVTQQAIVERMRDSCFQRGLQCSLDKVSVGFLPKR